MALPPTHHQPPLLDGGGHFSETPSSVHNKRRPLVNKALHRRSAEEFVDNNNQFTSNVSLGVAGPCPLTRKPPTAQAGPLHGLYVPQQMIVKNTFLDCLDPLGDLEEEVPPAPRSCPASGIGKLALSRGLRLITLEDLEDVAAPPAPTWPATPQDDRDAADDYSSSDFSALSTSGRGAALGSLLLGSDAMPTVGSRLHAEGACRPCAFLYKQGCENGIACEFCHLCKPGEKKRRQREKRASKKSGSSKQSKAEDSVLKKVQQHSSPPFAATAPPKQSSFPVLLGRSSCQSYNNNAHNSFQRSRGGPDEKLGSPPSPLGGHKDCKGKEHLYVPELPMPTMMWPPTPESTSDAQALHPLWTQLSNTATPLSLASSLQRATTVATSAVPSPPAPSLQPQTVGLARLIRPPQHTAASATAMAALEAQAYDQRCKEIEDAILASSRQHWASVGQMTHLAPSTMAFHPNVTSTAQGTVGQRRNGRLDIRTSNRDRVLTTRATTNAHDGCGLPLITNSMVANRDRVSNVNNLARPNRRSAEDGTLRIHLRETLRKHLKELQQEDELCVLFVRKINRLGFESPQILKEYFSQYGGVDRVLVAHSLIRSQSRDNTERMRPSGLGFVVMKDRASAQRALGAGDLQEVVGLTIKVHQYERRELHQSTSEAGDDDYTGGVEDFRLFEMPTFTTCNMQYGCFGGTEFEEC
eukprot:TRINITY_DN28784_c0_g1_i1.p1 TRINITY_DN28784_c0_g1~~TRINITY_DN28784_c0_g1_i1.p1  ORF type:complete len:697 (-),score=152.79 TRINITY_DN28784_c0_g1_i1:286-2376(-)